MKRMKFAEALGFGVFVGLVAFAKACVLIESERLRLEERWKKNR